MLSVNSVLVPAEANVEVTFTSNMLVVYIDRHSKQVCLLPLDEKRQRKPKPYPFKVIAGLVEAEAVIKAQLDIPTYHLLEDSSFTTSRIVKRNERYQIISPIISEIHRYMFPRYGRSIVAQVAQKTGMQPTAIVRLMNMWFYGGQTINALLGDYSQVGITSPGKNARKVGAKRKNSPFVGRAITEQDIAKIRRFLNKYVLTRKIEEQMTLQGAYDEMLDLEYSTLLVAANGRKKVVAWSDDDIPSYSQFYYHARKYFDEQKKYPRQFQVTAAAYQKDHAGRTATIERINRPGELFQIDETPFDVVLVANRFSITGLCVGSPTLYLVYDVHSNLVVGIHLTLNPPSWEGMRQALLNAFLPKVSFVSGME
ncbi:hypothetical protein HNQ57_001373 [Zhongshania antarctica]|uniref:Uncharacterized protein n=1 Tax=Zhongshania antarctica TaxID=641702 RepID=A0A840R3U6_9GAMM|nr:hypothetical protein [Zhongshania antarctica]MBB5187110.1 hypothetical protein [Zhongshania antarctica]